MTIAVEEYHDVAIGRRQRRIADRKLRENYSIVWVAVDERVVGISKLARVIEIYARRLQIQETMTAQIADTIQEVLQPKGVALLIDAKHQCMTTRGVHKPNVSTITSHFTGVFKDDPRMEQRFLTMIRG